MKNRFVACILMLVMVGCSAYIGGYRSLSQERDEIAKLGDVVKAEEFDNMLESDVFTKFIAKIVGVEPLNLQ
jgi:hypothetical protein